MKFSTIIAVAALAISTLSGCGKIHTNEVGLRTAWNGHVEEKVEPQGFYVALASHVDTYSLKEIPVTLDNLTPKAKDNLLMQELDVTVFYSVAPEQIRQIAIKRTGMSVLDRDNNVYWPAYLLVKSVAESETAQVVATIDSLEVHKNLDNIANSIKTKLQASLNSSDPGVFQITRVVIRKAKTDPTIEQSIRNVVSKEKELEASKLQVQIAQANAEATAKTAQTLTPAFLQHEYNQVLLKFAEHGGTVIVDGSSSNKILNIKQ